MEDSGLDPGSAHGRDQCGRQDQKERGLRNVIVTGATRGLGLDIARRLVRDGYRVLATGRSETDELRVLAEESRDSLVFKAFDLAESDKIAAFSRELLDAAGPVYGLVNNAGMGLDGVLGTMHNSDIERVMRVNAISPMILTKYVSRSMMLNRGGRIVNISSIIASTGFSGLAAYAASKAALEGFTRSLARELGRVGITVNAVAPGYMQTDMTQSLQGEKLQSILRRSPLRRLASTEDAAAAVAYLLSADAASITGTVLTVDAGSTC
jgi:3-oxoacyl-[acyl-carrier protein] reductase